MAQQWLELRPFAPAGRGAAASIRAGVERAGTVLSLCWKLAGENAPRALPVQAPASGRIDRLWEHTCFEAFLAPAGSEAYWEVNLSPAGQWNVYRFAGYRRDMRPEKRASVPDIEAAGGDGGAFTLAATLDLAPIAEIAAVPLALGLAAVIESAGGALGYWALHHAAERPDFHRRESFVAALNAPERVA